eukprot:SAG11_NODE_1212_length_5506_cov_3.818384_9_plen_121_part_00
MKSVPHLTALLRRRRRLQSLKGRSEDVPVDLTAVPRRNRFEAESDLAIAAIAEFRPVFTEQQLVRIPQLCAGRIMRFLGVPNTGYDTLPCDAARPYALPRRRSCCSTSSRPSSTASSTCC